MRLLSKFTVLTLVLMPFMSKSQFRDASIVQSSVLVTPMFPSNTGNDIMDYLGNTYEVFVWDDNVGNNDGMGWRVGGVTGTYFWPGSYDVKDPDVVLVNNNGGTVFALVSYYKAGTNEFVLDCFQFNNGVQSFFLQSHNPVMTGNYEKTVNIDANEDGDFMMVWDEQPLIIRCVTGFTPTGGFPTFNMGGSFLQLEPGHSPDIAMRQLSNGAKQADIVYIAQTNRVIIDFYNYSDLSNGNVQVINGYRSPTPDFLYRYPRIAVPNSSLGDLRDFSVVVEDSDNGSTWLIKGINYNACCNPNISLTTYNDGTTGNSPYNLSDYPNLRPVVTYDKNYFSVWVSWNFDNTAGLLPAMVAVRAMAPITMAADRKALASTGSDYMYVPNGIIAGDQYNYVSLAGRNSTKSLLTYYKTSNQTIYYKSVNQSPIPSSLRVSESYDLIQILNDLSMISPDSDNITIELFDVTGKVVGAFKGSATSLLEQTNAASDKTAYSVLFARIISGNEVYSCKYSPKN